MGRMHVQRAIELTPILGELAVTPVFLIALPLCLGVSIASDAHSA